MDRTDLQQLSKDELIEMVLRLQRPAKDSRTSSKPPSTDKKDKRVNSRPGGAKPGHEPHNRVLADVADVFRDHEPNACTRCEGSCASGKRRNAEQASRLGQEVFFMGCCVQGKVLP